MNDIGRIQWLHHHLASGAQEDLATGLEPFVASKDGEQVVSRDGLRALSFALTDHLFGRWRHASTAGVSFAYWCATLETGPRADALQTVLDMPWEVPPGAVDSTVSKLNQLCQYLIVSKTGAVSVRATSDIDGDERALLDPKPDTFVQLFLESMAKDSQSFVGSQTERLEPILKLVATTLVNGLPNGAQRFLAPFDRHASKDMASARIAASARFVAMQAIAGQAKDNDLRPLPCAPAQRRPAMHL